MAPAIEQGFCKQGPYHDQFLSTETGWTMRFTVGEFTGQYIWNDELAVYEWVGTGPAQYDYF